MSQELAVLHKLKCADVARLIPTLPESKKEERATSLLLATFRVVPTYALELLQSVGAPGGVRTRIFGFTEVVAKSKELGKLRPDGLIVVDTGRSTWTALVEAKVGSNELTPAQIESYIPLARDLQCDALITISNQFAALPTHHPTPVSKAKLGKLGLFHFSWLSLVSSAVLLAEHKQVDDPEQAFILDELIRYLQHPRSGVSLMTEIGAGWRKTSSDVLQGMKLLKGAENVNQAVSSWQQLTRFLALQMTLAVAKPVSLVMTRKQAGDPELRIRTHVDELVNSQTLSDQFDIPNAAGRLSVSADFARRALVFAMGVQCPKDKKFASASINWLIRQIDSGDSKSLIRARWPGRTADTIQSVVELREDANRLIPDGCKALPVGLEVVRVVDLAGTFQQKRKFVEQAERELVRFYIDVGQHLKNWIPPAPKVKKEITQNSTNSVPSEQARIPDKGLVWAREFELPSDSQEDA